MARCDCCGCVFQSDYGTSLVGGSGARDDPYAVSMVDASWVRPAARVRRTTTQSIATGASFTPISFDLEVFDQSGNFWIAAAPTRFTIPVAGLYIFGACAVWAANATGTRELGLRLNGATILQVNDQPPDSANGGTNTPWQTVGYQSKLSPGDYLELIARQESGGALNLTAAADESIVFWIVYAGKTT